MVSVMTGVGVDALPVETTRTSSLPLSIVTYIFCSLKSTSMDATASNIIILVTNDTKLSGFPDKSECLYYLSDMTRHTHDAMEEYFMCLTSCDLNDKECTTQCVEELKEEVAVTTGWYPRQYES